MESLSCLLAFLFRSAYRHNNFGSSTIRIFRNNCDSIGKCCHCKLRIFMYNIFYTLIISNSFWQRLIWWQCISNRCFTQRNCCCCSVKFYFLFFPLYIIQSYFVYFYGCSAVVLKSNYFSQWQKVSAASPFPKLIVFANFIRSDIKKGWNAPTSAGMQVIFYIRRFNRILFPIHLKRFGSLV